MHLRRIEIKGYRGIRKLTLDLDQQINIFVGRNNTGKSSILEAIMLAATASSQYYDALGNDILEVIRRRIGEGKERYLINVDEHYAIIQALLADLPLVEMSVVPPNLSQVDEEWIRDALSNLYELIQQRKEERRRKFLERYEKALERKTLERYRRGILFGIEEEFKPIVNFLTRIDASISLAALTETGIFRAEKGITSELLFAGRGLKPSISELYSVLTRRGLIPKVMENLRRDIPYLVDLRYVTDGELMVFLDWVEEPLPLELMGDGFKELLRMAFVLSLPKTGEVMFLLEEPESNLHPGFIELVTEYIAGVSKKGRAQFFISTQSGEFLENLIDKAAEIVKVFRMYREVDGEITYESFEGMEARDLLKSIRADLRGI